VATTFLGLLCCPAEKAVFVCVFTAIFLDTSVLQSTEDGIRSVVFVEIFFVLCEFRLVVLEFVLGGFELGPGISNDFGLRRITRVRISKNAILNEGYAEVAELGINPVADRSWEIFFEFVDCAELDL
jgi:hypothetical protein